MTHRISRLLRADNRGLLVKFAIAFGLFSSALVSFIYVADEVGDGETLAYDAAILLWFNALATPELDRLMVFLTDLGGVIVIGSLTAALIAYLFYKRRTYAALMLTFGVGGAALINLLLKSIFERVRPDLWTQIVTEVSFSFPSGHAMGSSALALSIIVILWRTKWRTVSIVLGLFYVIIIGVTRLYLGVHYPTDIIGGWLISLGWIAVVASFIFHWSLTKLRATENDRLATKYR